MCDQSGTFAAVERLFGSRALSRGRDHAKPSCHAGSSLARHVADHWRRSPLFSSPLHVIAQLRIGWAR